METGLHLLTRDGAIRVAFSPRLTSGEYAELMVVVEAEKTPSKDELCEALRRLSLLWGKKLEISDGTDHVRTQ